jgi:hypothetical protein
LLFPTAIFSWVDPHQDVVDCLRNGVLPYAGQHTVSSSFSCISERSLREPSEVLQGTFEVYPSWKALNRLRKLLDDWIVQGCRKQERLRQWPPKTTAHVLATR